MKFFLPFAVDLAQAERVLHRIAERLNEMGYEVTNERIHKIIYRRGDKLVSEVVGGASDNGEIVVAIFKNHIGFFICSYSHGVVWGDPIVARYSTVESSEAFD